MYKFKSLCALAIFCCSSLGHAKTLPGVVNAYADHVFARYTETLNEAIALENKIQQFATQPTEANLTAAKEQWIKARKLYSSTEVFRFYSGPIDRDGGPEALINAWPLDEAFIDSVQGQPQSGLINNLKDYPTLSKQLLVQLNEFEGEKNITTGWHAIEFMLWGQDFNPTGPGQRPVSDFTSAPNADRRKLYLQLISQLLVEHLASLQREWDPNISANFRSQFVQPPQLHISLGSILKGTIQLAGEELSQERMFVAYDTQSQEDELSCFSDTTHFDLQFNFLGIKEVLSLAPASILDLLALKNRRQADRLSTQILSAQLSLRKVPTPFEQAIASKLGRAAILTAITELENLAQELKASAVVLGVKP